MSPFEIIVFVDIPDPDNILMVAEIIIAYPDKRIAIVPSPRILDLSVARYGDDFDPIKKVVGLKRMALPIESATEIPDVPRHLKRWFYIDANLSDPDVNHDTRLYVQVSVLRIVETLQRLNIDRKRYDIFWDSSLLETLKRPDMRHAFHVHDFKYNFNEREMEMYKRAIKSSPEGGVEHRMDLRHVIDLYIKRIEAGLGRTESEILKNFEDLIKANLTTKATLIIGGPFTEALRYLRQTSKPPKEVIGMGGSMTGDRNLFNDIQFNFWKDLSSARGFLRHVKEHRISLYMVPTECVKGIPKGPQCPFEFKWDDYAAILKHKPVLYGIIKEYMQDTGRTDLYPAFDWITAIAATRKDIFEWEKVRFVLKNMKEGGKIHFRHASEDSSSTIRMAMGNYEEMEHHRQTVLDQMRKTVNGGSH